MAAVLADVQAEAVVVGAAAPSRAATTVDAALVPTPPLAPPPLAAPPPPPTAALAGVGLSAFGGVVRGEARWGARRVRPDRSDEEPPERGAAADLDEKDDAESGVRGVWAAAAPSRGGGVPVFEGSGGRAVVGRSGVWPWPWPFIEVAPLLPPPWMLLLLLPPLPDTAALMRRARAASAT